MGRAGTTSIWDMRRTRRALVQAIYQWQLADANTRQIEEEFEDSLKKADRTFFRAALTFVALRTEELDALLATVVDRPLGSLDEIERAVLRLGAYELSQRPEVPYRVVIDEAVELAKVFGAQDGHKYVNAVLDRVARQVRPVETGSGRRP